MITNFLQKYLQKNKGYFYLISFVFIITMSVFAGCKTKIIERDTTIAPSTSTLVLIDFANTSGWAGNAVVLRGTGFGDEIAKNTVKFGNITARVIDFKGMSINGRDVYELTVVVPENAVTGKISVTANNTTATYPNDFVINTNNVYAAGLEESTKTPFPIAKYFKNGNAVKNFSDGTKEITMTKILVVGTDVYIIGKEGDTNTKYWKNGVAVRFGNNEDIINDIFVNGNDVYLVGDEMTINNSIPWYVRTVYWKNGIINDISSEFGVRANGASSIFITGNDIYIAGYGLDYRGGGNPTPIQYFKNGIGVNLDNATFNNNTAILVSGNDIYLAGAESGNGQNFIGKYWKNGVLTTFNNSLFFPTALSVVDNDIYVAGYSNQIPTQYYKNNMPFLLENSTNKSYKQAITVLNNNVYVTANSNEGANYWKNGKKMPYLGATTLTARDKTTLNAMVVTQ